MRIAYVAPYQGQKLIKARPSKTNLALAGNLKIELVSELLAHRGHDVQIISQGEVVENSARYFPGFSESTPGGVPVRYASALPVKFLNGYWSARGVRSILDNLNDDSRFDAVLIYNMKVPQIVAARHALQRLRIPVVVEFEDDSFVDIGGRSAAASFKHRWHRRRELAVLDKAAASICVSPHLQARFFQGKSSLLLRGVVSDEIVALATAAPLKTRKRIVAFSGTFAPSKGLAPLIEAWKQANLDDWELHLAGDGSIADDLHRRAAGVKSIKFRGLLNRQENAAFLAEARIGINPHDLSATPGNVFAFKIIEYLAANLHVISTPMGRLERELEAGMTYLDDNSVEEIARGLVNVIRGSKYENLAVDAARDLYGSAAIAGALDTLMRDAIGADNQATTAGVAA